MRTSILMFCLMILSEVAVAAPPPPPPEFISNIAMELIRNPTPQSFESYSAKFAIDLRVFVDGHEVAKDKEAWLTLERARLGKVNRYVIGYAEGQENILVVDEFDDVSDCRRHPDMVCDPRFITRAARYQFGSDHLIHEVRFVQGGSFFIPAPPSR